MTNYTLTELMNEVRQLPTNDFTYFEVEGDKVVRYCDVSKQLGIDPKYRRYEVTTKRIRKRGDHFKCMFGFMAKNASLSFDEVVFVPANATSEEAKQLLIEAHEIGCSKGKVLYDGGNLNAWHKDYVDPNAEPEPEPIEIDHSVSLVEVGSIDLLDTEEAPIMILEEYVVSDADVDESEEWTGFYGLPDFANWIDFEIIKMHSDAPQAAELSKIFGTTIDLARSGTFNKNIYIKIGDAACYGEAQLQYFQGWGFYVSMKSINYFVGDPEAVAGDDLLLAAEGNIYAIEE